jgi:parvulin-like peptidyl-prolyl isomerase
MLSLFPPERAAAEIDSGLRTTINEPLVKLEANARKTAEVPEVAEDVRMFQEDRMESLLYDDHILKDVTVSEDDVKNYFAEHQKEFVAPERRKISHIVVESEDAAKKIREQITGGEDFVTLVKSKSHDTESARTGGDLGWITPKDVPAGFADVLKLQAGEVSGPVQSKFGWHLIKVVQIEPERLLTFEEAKDKIRKVVLEKKQREKRAYWVKKLRDAATIKVNKRAIRAYVRNNEFKAAAAPPQHGAK